MINDGDPSETCDIYAKAMSPPDSVGVGTAIMHSKYVNVFSIFIVNLVVFFHPLEFIALAQYGRLLFFRVLRQMASRYRAARSPKACARAPRKVRKSPADVSPGLYSEQSRFAKEHRRLRKVEAGRIRGGSFADVVCLLAPSSVRY